ncbi:hypothetical protein F5Y13DRAFT_135105 [Hypoxylon sp. FL1857]|nr:hypothetical protein F5Y13DRAFT_135105 [Hypoxylon sp. FL1857]
MTDDAFVPVGGLFVCLFVRLLAENLKQERLKKYQMAYGYMQSSGRYIIHDKMMKWLVDSLVLCLAHRAVARQEEVEVGLDQSNNMGVANVARVAMAQSPLVCNIRSHDSLRAKQVHNDHMYIPRYLYAGKDPSITYMYYVICSLRSYLFVCRYIAMSYAR